MPPTIFISAGEASGEHYGALLIDALKKQLAEAGQTASFFGMGGERMAAAGLECVVRAEEMAVMGLTEVFCICRASGASTASSRTAIRERRPSVAVLIDFPEIHFRLAEELHRLGVPVIFFVSPQLWAWKKKRIRLVQKYIDKMLVIFPFEEAFYREQGVEAEFVGHPLAELPRAVGQPRAVCRRERIGPSEYLDRPAPRQPSQGDSRPPADDAEGSAGAISQPGIRYPSRPDAE